MYIFSAAALKDDLAKQLSGRLVVSAAVHQERFEGVSSRLVEDRYSPDFVVTGEASELAVERGQRGRAKATGIFGEPAGVTGFAGFRKMARQGLLGKNERVVIIVTGNGLKDIEGAKKSAGEPMVVDSDLDQLRRVLEGKLEI